MSAMLPSRFLMARSDMPVSGSVGFRMSAWKASPFDSTAEMTSFLRPSFVSSIRSVSRATPPLASLPPPGPLTVIVVVVVVTEPNYASLPPCGNLAEKGRAGAI